jgi:hypothetical protein
MIIGALSLPAVLIIGTILCMYLILGCIMDVWAMLLDEPENLEPLAQKSSRKCN